MAVYEYKCNHCDTLMRPATKIIRGVTDVHIWKCPKCRYTKTSELGNAIYSYKPGWELVTYDAYVHTHYREFPVITQVTKTAWTAYNDTSAWTAWKE